MFLLGTQTKVLLILPLVPVVIPAQGPSEWVNECGSCTFQWEGHLDPCLFWHVPLTAKECVSGICSQTRPKHRKGHLSQIRGELPFAEIEKGSFSFFFLDK